MTLHFVDQYPLLGIGCIDEYEVFFAWVWKQPRLRVTFADFRPALIGNVTHLDGIPRFTGVPENHDWLSDDETREPRILDQAIDFWTRKDRIFKTMAGTNYSAGRPNRTETPGE